jgi:large subunit ribosomal protein L15
MPLHMRIPKRGFNNIFAKDYADREPGRDPEGDRRGKLDAKAVIDQAALKAAGLTRGGKDGVRLLAKGELTAKLSFTVAGASKGAIEAVEKARRQGRLPEIVPAAEKAKAKGKRRCRRSLPPRRLMQGGAGRQAGSIRPRRI